LGGMHWELDRSRDACARHTLAVGYCTSRHQIRELESVSAPFFCACLYKGI
jgi:hypothetical protein